MCIAMCDSLSYTKAFRRPQSWIDGPSMSTDLSNNPANVARVARRKGSMADKETTERRVYVLPTEQLERIRAYQADNGISSEVEAVRRLLDVSLQLRDTVPDLLRKLKSRFSDERDLRVLARDILALHPLVINVRFDDRAVSFSFADEDHGRIDTLGQTYRSGTGHSDDWSLYPPVERRPRGGGGGAPTWDAPKGGDPDDEIPF